MVPGWGRGARGMGGFARFLAARLAAALASILILYTLVFVILRVLPGNPILAVLGTRSVPPEVLRSLEERLGLDKPLYIQYFDYLLRVLHGDFGYSMVHLDRPIAADIAERLPATLELAVSAMLFATLVAIPLGLLAASRGGLLDAALRVAGIVAYTLFIPWLGLMLQLVFGVWLHLLPVSGRIDPGLAPPRITGLYVLDALLTRDWEALRSALAHLVLPTLTLGLVISGPYLRMVRNSVASELRQGYVTMLRAVGAPESLVLRRVFRSALIPIVTYAGLQFALLMGGAVLTETTFDWPGLGTYLVEAISYRDYPAVQAVVIVFAAIVAAIGVVLDIVYALIDPRVRA